MVRVLRIKSDFSAESSEFIEGVDNPANPISLDGNSVITYINGEIIEDAGATNVSIGTQSGVTVTFSEIIEV